MLHNSILPGVFLVVFLATHVVICPGGLRFTRSRGRPSSGLPWHLNEIIRRGLSSHRAGSSARTAIRVPSSSGSDSSGSGEPYSDRLEKLAAAFKRFHTIEAYRSSIKHGMLRVEREGVQQSMTAAAINNECKNYSSRSSTGHNDCVRQFLKFMTIPREHRGLCANAYMAYCWRLIRGSPKVCAFFLKRSAGDTSPLQGEWVDILQCANDINLKYDDPYTESVFGASSSNFNLFAFNQGY